jgi:hypothetical protein
MVVVMPQETSAADQTGHRDDFARLRSTPRPQPYRRPPPLMPHLEEIAYDLGRAALADQESLVSGIRSRTGTLIATQALVASFLGGAALDRGALGASAWAAIAMLVVGLGMSAIVLAPWRMDFALDAQTTYFDLEDAARAGGLEWVALVGFAHQDLLEENRWTTQLLSKLSVLISIATMLELLLWIAALALR